MVPNTQVGSLGDLNGGGRVSSEHKNRTVGTYGGLYEGEFSTSDVESDET